MTDPHARYPFRGVIKRRRPPNGPVSLTVTTRLGWSQSTMYDLFTPQLEAHMVRLGLGERARIGFDRAFSVIAIGTSSQGWWRADWPAGAAYPDWTLREVVDPPYDTEE